MGAMPDKGGAAKAGESQVSMNRLVPYLDLFDKLGDVEISRLAAVPLEIVARMRVQVLDVQQQLARWRDLLPRLSDAELSRLTNVSEKTVRFWRLTRPSTEPLPEVLAASESGVGMAVPTQMQGDHTPVAGVPAATTTGPHTPVPAAEGDDDDDLELGIVLEDEDEENGGGAGGGSGLPVDDDDDDWSDL